MISTNNSFQQVQKDWQISYRCNREQGSLLRMCSLLPPLGLAIVWPSLLIGPSDDHHMSHSDASQSSTPRVSPMLLLKSVFQYVLHNEFQHQMMTSVVVCNILCVFELLTFDIAEKKTYIQPASLPCHLHNTVTAPRISLPKALSRVHVLYAVAQQHHGVDCGE